mgnify:CR=1 FL=1
MRTYTPTEFGRIMRLSRKHVYDLLREGGLPPGFVALKFGKTWRIVTRDPDEPQQQEQRNPAERVSR